MRILLAAMRYSYSIAFPPREDGSYIIRPMVDIRIFGPQGERNAKALIDSGADFSIAHAEYAEKLGVEKQRDIEIVGVNRQPLKGFVGVMALHIEGIPGMRDVPFVFVDRPSEHIILGQEGFFDMHQIRFARHQRMFEITKVRNKSS